jgi:hypothetical protein
VTRQVLNFSEAPLFLSKKYKFLVVSNKSAPIAYMYPPIFATITDHMWKIITQLKKVDWLAADVLPNRICKIFRPMRSKGLLPCSLPRIIKKM